MEGFKLYTHTELLAITNIRDGEIKIGQKMQTVTSLEEIAHSNAQFVVLGIPEDYGVRANHGIAGTAGTWEPFLKTLVNVQSTGFLTGQEILLLGHFEFDPPQEDSLAALSAKVDAIDDLVYPVIRSIIAAGKVPVVIGGGHNNAYPIIKGFSLAKGKAVDVINIDAHADLRSTGSRHSGNAFSYAIKDGYLENYGIYGLQENYNNAAVLRKIESSDNISYIYFDELVKTSDHTDVWADFNKSFDYRMGLEIDLDSIENMLSSAATPSGFTLNDVRKMVMTTKKKLSYLHLAEGAVALSDGRTDQSTAKALVYLATDFIKAQSNS
ncbi:formimidoylglutamase [Pedobacter immunditicola]|uniref:formimidoylglutamase n=1 Tax=Pedobacter immunditicola TaxID=3133440 RepID=UPI0030A73333